MNLFQDLFVLLDGALARTGHVDFAHENLNRSAQFVRRGGVKAPARLRFAFEPPDEIVERLRQVAHFRVAGGRLQTHGKRIGRGVLRLRRQPVKRRQGLPDHKPRQNCRRSGHERAQLPQRARRFVQLFLDERPLARHNQGLSRVRKRASAPTRA